MLTKELEAIFETWYPPLKEAGCIDLLDGLLGKLDVLYENTIVFPTKENIFRAFRETPYENTKAILLGQDPYHDLKNGVPNACGLSFITETDYVPPSLKNMFKELENDDVPRIKGNNKHPYTAENYPYKRWLEQGVLMLNAYLTVEKGVPTSHSRLWQMWTYRFIAYIVKNRPDIVWILLGRSAERMLQYKDCKKVVAAHPSPLAGGAFFNSKIFSRTNSLLKEKITW